VTGEWTREGAKEETEGKQEARKDEKKGLAINMYSFICLQYVCALVYIYIRYM
jgi:hypothetical protein